VLLLISFWMDIMIFPREMLHKYPSSLYPFLTTLIITFSVLIYINKIHLRHILSIKMHKKESQPVN
jgi:hypothetical protein